MTITRHNCPLTDETSAVEALARLVVESVSRLVLSGSIRSTVAAERLAWRAVMQAAMAADSDRENVLDGLFLPVPLRAQSITGATSAAAARLLDQSSGPADVIGRAFETVCGRSNSDASSKNRRRDQGVFFTPQPLVSLTVELALSPLVAAAASPSDVLGIRVCDPAAGAGAFLLGALEVLAARLIELDPSISVAQARHDVIQHCLYGVDADATAVAVCRALLLVRAGLLNPGTLGSHILWGDSLLWDPRSDQSDGRARPSADAPPLAWPHAFPAVLGDLVTAPGFDVVIGNPPWGAVKPAFKEYHAHHDDRVRNGQGSSLREEVEATTSEAVWSEWTGYQESVRSYAATLRGSSAFAHQGIGDTELYRYFLELAHQLVTAGGRVAMVIPAAFERAEGAAPLRRLLLTTGTFEHLLDFENRKRLFPIHSMFRFAVAVWQQGAATGIRNVAFGLQGAEEARRIVSDRTAVPLSVQFLASSGDRLSIPEVRTARDRDLFGRLHSAAPPLGDRLAGPWTLGFVRELDMTNDSGLFVRAADVTKPGSRAKPPMGARQGAMVPVYEGRLVHQFDCAAKAYVGGDGRMAKWEPLPYDCKVLQTHFLVDSRSPKVQDRWPRVSRAGFCDVTGHANERTVLAALIPGSAICGNKVPTCRFEPDLPDLHLLWLALANSFVVDWCMRRRVGTSMNYFLWAQLPMPRLDPAVPEAQELIDLAGQLSRFPWEHGYPDDVVRAGLRAAVDAAVADLYGIDIDDYAWLLTDFPLLDRGQPTEPAVGPRRPVQRATITRDTALLALARRRGLNDLDTRDLPLAAVETGPTSVAERVALGSNAGAVGYVPGELAGARLEAGRSRRAALTGVKRGAFGCAR